MQVLDKIASQVTGSVSKLRLSDLKAKFNVTGFKLSDIKSKASEIADKRYKRSRRKINHDPLMRPLKYRLDSYLIKLAEKHIRFRDRASQLSPRDGRVVHRDIINRYWLINAWEYIQYSRAFGSRRNEATWLCGYDDGHLFVVRVPSTIQTCQEAVNWLKPSEANKPGTVRQGDLWFIPTKRGSIDSIVRSCLDTRHDPVITSDGQVMILHPEHNTLILPNDHYKVVLGKRIVQGTTRQSYD